MKYIVYKTTNLKNGFIYIGVHGTEDPNVFDGYLGNGCYINKPNTYKYSKTNFQIAINEFGVSNFRRETLYIYDTPEEAYAMEAEIVNYNFLARPDVYNMILGGYGALNKIEIYQYDLNGNYIKTFESISEAERETGKTNIWRSMLLKTKSGDFYYNTDKLDKIDLTKYNKVIPQEVYCYSVNGGNLINEYKSISKAAEDTNKTIIEVSRSAKLGYRVGEYQFCFVKADTYDKAKKIYINNRPVHKYSKEGIYLKSYNTQYKAELDNPGSNITRSIKNKKPCENGFLWGLEKVPIYNQQTSSKKKKVGKFKDGVLIKEWNSVKECLKEEKSLDKAYITHEIPYKGFIYKHI